MENYSQIQTNILFVAQLISLFISASALIGLLWQTKYPYKKKQRINFNIAKSTSNNKKKNANLCVFTALNTGRVDINIEEFGIMYHKKILFKISNSNFYKLEPMAGIIEKFPLRLNTQSKFLIAYSLDDIINDINIINFKNNKKIMVYFKDSLGKITKHLISKNKNILLYRKLKEKSTQNSRHKYLKNKSDSKVIKINVSWYNNEKGYGFGIIKNSKENIFFHKTSIIEKIDQIYEGDIIHIKFQE